MSDKDNKKEGIRADAFSFFRIFACVMKKKSAPFVLFLVCLLATTALQAQVSHGGKPLSLSLPYTKSADNGLFVDMPAFDMAEQLRIDSLERTDLRSSFRFAYKFMTSYTPDNSGIRFTLPDGTRVWRLGIRSAQAHSLNIMFTDYEVPAGAQLFVYNADQSEVLGAFNQLNNSERGMLPVAPVQGSELIIEYQEPAGAPFRGKLKVGEVNHGYRSFKEMKPQDDKPAFECQPTLACYQGITDQYETVGRSVVLLIIDGIFLCTGTLTNNTSADGKPYLLTASHCLNRSFNVENPDYEEVAGSIICFFNYDSPLCSPVMRGTEEMSVASAHYRAVNEDTDMALLELQETPPAHYRPYYAGWNAKDAGQAPYAGIHHPGGSVKRINTYEEALTLKSYIIPGVTFLDNSFWKVGRWTTGSTAEGSSGSPLFDTDNRIVGALTGGGSNCYSPENDYYYAISKSWEPSEASNQQLKYWLDPAAAQKPPLCNGLDPYATAPCIRLSNIRENGLTESIETTLLPGSSSGYLFGTNTAGTNEYAEAYKIAGQATLYGTYIVNASAVTTAGFEVEINVYSGTDKPETLLHTERLYPKQLSRDQESYVSFATPVTVGGTFYISYKIKGTGESSFAVFSLPKGKIARNTAWIKYKEKWITATEHPTLPFATSLFIDPVVQYGTEVSNETIEETDPVRIFAGAERKTIHVLLPQALPDTQFTLLSIEGKTIYNEQIYSEQTTLPIGSIRPGVYIASIRYNNKLYTQKMLF